MNLKLLLQNKKLSNWFRYQVVYLSGEHSLLSRSPDQEYADINKSRKLITIIARQHYSESWQTYPAVSSNELNKILKLQQSHNAIKLVQRIIINKEQDGFDVKTVTFKKEVEQLVGKNSILIPETELLRYSIENNERKILEIETLKGTLYWAYSANKVHSSYKKGLMSNINSFKQSVGVPAETNAIQLSPEQYSQLLFDLLESTAVNELYKVASVNVNVNYAYNKLHVLYVAPLSAATIFFLLSNTYLYARITSVESQISEQRIMTNSILTQKKNIDEIKNVLSAVNNEIENMETAHELWVIAGHAIDAGMEISRFRRYKEGIELRGTAEKASDVLNAVNQIQGVTDASFVGSVRKSRGKDFFSILLQYTHDVNKVD